MLVKTGTPQQMEYLDSCIRMAVGEISNLDTTGVSRLLNVSKLSYADTLSQLSVFTKVSLLVLDNYANISAPLLSNLLENERLLFSRPSFTSDKLVLIQDIIRQFTENVTVAQKRIIDIYKLDSDALSVFNYDRTEAGIDFREMEETSPLFFKYYEGKMALKNITGVLKLFTNAKDIYDKNIKSISILSQDKGKDILNYLSNTIKYLQGILTNTEYIIDSTDIARKMYIKLLLDNERYYNSFLGRSYDTIKKEIINNYFD